MKYGSDLMAEYIASLNIPYIALNPGASFRGLHDSLVNHPSVEMPQLIECTHEEISVSIAHGYAKATGEPMAAAIHNIVGLQHASMAIFNAWCDRTPIMLFGGTGPMKVEKRRPWIDWIHTAFVQGNLVRDFVKWDDQPASLHSLQDSIYRAYKLTKTEPAGPVYVCFDADLQEEPIPVNEENKDILSFGMPTSTAGFVQAEAPAPSTEMIDLIAEAIKSASWPVIIADLTGRSAYAFELLSKLSKEWAIPVIDRGSRLNIPTDHPMNLSYDTQKVLAQADVVIALDVMDLFGVTSKINRVQRTTESILKSNARVFSISLNDYLVRSWSNDFQKMFPTEANILADSASALKMLISRLGHSNVESPSYSKYIELRYIEVSHWHKRLRDNWMTRARKEETLKPITPPD
ncbi:thiamine pyrophosphate-binding protein [Halalkalibacter okhensis]|uniref:thiamine pyrophosphate-binding protein n=1 Tax=Halalkalibacter okhensis TaxID=333138 RepID=UPI000AC0684C|nr:thiamine pyrophosphate-binding protein [Halalkalibacter okhensis]